VYVTARRAAGEDLPIVAQLVADATAAVATERGGTLFAAREGVPEPVQDHLDRCLSDPAVCVAVGCADGTVFGAAIAVAETLRDGQCLARLTFLWVDAGLRQVGLGREMMDFVLEWCREVGADRFDAYALPGDRETKNFLEGAGFSARLIVMNRPVDRTKVGRQR
jgi:GNAT superfamily N-acetyltransferase